MRVEPPSDISLRDREKGGQGTKTRETEFKNLVFFLKMGKYKQNLSVHFPLKWFSKYYNIHNFNLNNMGN